MFTAFQAQYGRLSSLSAGTPALPSHLLSALEDKKHLVQFLYFYWVWNLLLLHGGFCHVFFSSYVCKQPGSQSTATTALSSVRAATSATSANCSSVRGAAIQSTQLLQLNVKAPSKPEAVTPESSSWHWQVWNMGQKPVQEQTILLLWQNHPQQNFTRSHHPAPDLPNLLAVTNFAQTAGRATLGTGNVSYVQIYLAQLKVKPCRTVATLSCGGVRFLPFSITQHSSAGPGPRANSIPPHCLRVLVCSSASTCAAVDMNRPRTEQRGHLCTQPWHSFTAIPAQHFHGCPLSPSLAGSLHWIAP